MPRSGRMHCCGKEGESSGCSTSARSSWKIIGTQLSAQVTKVLIRFSVLQATHLCTEPAALLTRNWLTFKATGSGLRRARVPAGFARGTFDRQPHKMFLTDCKLIPSSIAISLLVRPEAIPPAHG